MTQYAYIVNTLNVSYAHFDDFDLDYCTKQSKAPAQKKNLMSVV